MDFEEVGVWDVQREEVLSIEYLIALPHFE